MNFGTQVDLKNGMIISIVTKYSDLPSATLVPGQYYRTLQGENASWRPTWLGGTYYPEGIYYSDGSSWDYVGEFPYQATQSEVDSGMNNSNFVTPKTFTDASKWNTKFDVPSGLPTEYLDGEGNPQPFPSTTISDGDYGDVTVSGGGTIIEIDDNTIDDVKIVDVDANKVTENATHRFVTDIEKSTWNSKLSPNSPITASTKTKITYDSNGLVTAGGDATTADINDSLDKRYVTDADLVVLSNTSNTNTGDETQSTIISKLDLHSGTVDINFGVSGDFLQVTIPAVWVTPAHINKIKCEVTDDGSDHLPGEALLGGLSASVVSVNSGISFDVIITSQHDTWGTYKLKYNEII